VTGEGAQNVSYVWLMWSQGTDQVNVPDWNTVGQMIFSTDGRFALRNDNNTDWIRGNAGDGTTPANSRCAIPMNLWNQVYNGNTYSVIFNITFSAAFNGPTTVWGLPVLKDGTNSGGWGNMGAWTVAAGQPPQMPQFQGPLPEEFMKFLKPGEFEFNRPARKSKKPVDFDTVPFIKKVVN
jgi:hypothetical protein